MAVKEPAPPLHRSKTLSSSVALQFVLDTFIETYQRMLSLQRLIARNFGFPLAAFAFSQDSSAILRQLVDELEAIAATPTSAMVSTSDIGRGLLWSLRNDCQVLLDKGIMEAASLVEWTEKAWLEGHQALCAYKYGSPIDTDAGAPTVKRLPFLGHVAKMIQYIERIAKSWPKLLKNFRKDENVLLFLLRRHLELDSLFGPGYVRDLLIKLYPKGRERLRASIVNAYIDRGFQTLVPTIDAAIEEFKPW